MKRWVWIAVGLLFIVGLLFLVEWEQNHRKCTGIVIKLDSKAEYPFFGQEDIENLITLNGVDKIVGMNLSDIKMLGLEKRVMKNRLIKKCEVSRDLSGNLVVEIEQQPLVGRLAPTNSTGGYLTASGEIVPLSARYSARLVILSGDFFTQKNTLKSNTGQQLVQFLKELQQQPFWRAQIAEIVVAKDGEITLIPQVGKHIIDFGLPLNTETKLQKLKIFYKTILPLKGWNLYQKVSVKFKNQIVCE